MTNNDMLEVFELWHKWATRILYVLVAAVIFLFGYRYGYSKGFEAGVSAMAEYMKQNTPEPKASSYNDGEPGRAWDSEA